MMKAKESYADMRKKWNIDVDSDDHLGEHASSQDNASQLGLVGITALRMQGENKRFDDELAYLMDGLGPEEPLSLRRTSAVELLRKMTKESDFMRKLKTAGQVILLYQKFRDARNGNDDRVSCSHSQGLRLERISIIDTRFVSGYFCSNYCQKSTERE